MLICKFQEYSSSCDKIVYYIVNSKDGYLFVMLSHFYMIEGLCIISLLFFTILLILLYGIVYKVEYNI